MEFKLILESILFSAQKPLSTRDLRDLFQQTAEQSGDETAKSLKKVKEEDLTITLEQLQQEHENMARSFRLTCVAGSWQFVSRSEYAPWIMTLVGAKVRPPKLSHPALETLAILAYRQPVTRAEIEQIRGVAVDGVMQTLVERGLVETVGRAEVVGRPMTYGTTALFLEYFGLRRLQDLPAGDELRKVVVKKPEPLTTVEPDPAPLEQAVVNEIVVASPAKAGEEPASTPGQESASVVEENPSTESKPIE